MNRHFLPESWTWARRLGNKGAPWGSGGNTLESAMMLCEHLVINLGQLVLKSFLVPLPAVPTVLAMPSLPPLVSLTPLLLLLLSPTMPSWKQK